MIVADVVFVIFTTSVLVDSCCGNRGDRAQGVGHRGGWRRWGLGWPSGCWFSIVTTRRGINYFVGHQHLLYRRRSGSVKVSGRTGEPACSCGICGGCGVGMGGLCTGCSGFCGGVDCGVDGGLDGGSGFDNGGGVDGSR